MLTCCPACRTCFRITEAQLAVAQGKVRCGKCKTVFNARQHLQLVPGQSPAASSSAPQPAPTAPADDQTDHIDLLRAPQSEAHPPGSTSDETAPAGTSPQAADTPPGPEPSDTTASETDADAVPPAPSAVLAETTTGDPFETDETPASSASEQEQPVEAESEADPETVEIPMPDLDEMETESFTESHVDTESVNEATEAEPTEPDSRYKYNDFTDEIFSQHELEDILAEMDQQLSRGIDSPGPELSDSLAMPEGPRPPTEETPDELGEAIDTLFDDLQHEEALGDELPEIDDTAEATLEQAPDYDVRDSEESSLADASQSERLSEDRDFVDKAPVTTGTDDEAVPLRLRDSLAIQPPKRRSWLATLGGSLLILLLLVALVGQLILFRPLDVYRLLPQSKPYIEQLCQQLPCQFNARRDPTQIRLINRDVRAHPEQTDTLLITAALVNQADYQQAYPDLRVTLFNLSGNRVARRRFTPSDYLGSGYTPFMLMEPGTPLHIKLEVVDPGSDAVNFEFDFQ
ncbi:DUF3426 domain-containing protein [Thiohalophilus sp.]|uniref:DUF3426 domain-containing protein n=1 Tax=Thiohalophilus sp. TaxID=3028392 RepID=UPI002ACEDA51|nr:DUF3426 domain-containing protein [Thiohalophilus sp.]MDZ7661009.1 DUF3426 domain-containing protein [Thiohalophilus sp.]